MHWGGGGRSHNDHSIPLLYFGLELQKGPTCMYCVLFLTTICSFIWLKMMRMHIDLKICHFLLFTLSIAEAGKSKNKGETGIHGPSLCRGSTTKQFLFHRVLKKMAKFWRFCSLSWQLALKSKGNEYLTKGNRNRNWKELSCNFNKDHFAHPLKLSPIYMFKHDKSKTR